MKIIKILLTALYLSYTPSSYAILTDLANKINTWVEKEVAEPIGCSGFNLSLIPGFLNMVAPDTPIGAQTVDAQTGRLCLDSLIRLIATIAAGGPAGLPIAFLQIENMASIAKDTANKSHICLDDINNDNHPAAYTNDQILEILKKSGEPANVKNIVDKYQKLCIEYEGKIFWKNNGECFDPRKNGPTGMFDDLVGAATGGKDASKICVSHLSGYQYFLCARVIGACPCIMNLQMGTMEVEYETEDNGAIKFNKENGTPVIKNYDQFLSKFSKHCKVIRAPFLDQPEAKFFDGIIDETCYTLKGYSKAEITMSSILVQCLVNTARNIFEKPIFMNPGTFTVSQKNREYLNNLENDLKILKDTQSVLDAYAKEQMNNLNNFNVKNYISYLTKYLDNQYNLEKIKFYNEYQCGSLENSLIVYLSYNTTTDQEKENFIINSIAAMTNHFSNCEEKINNLKKTLSTTIFQEGIINININGANGGLTMAEKFQNSVKFMGIIAVFLWIVIFGYNALDGNIKLDIRSNMKYALEFGIVYYFAFSTAWRDMFLDIVMNATQGSSILFYQIGHKTNSYRGLNICDFGEKEIQLKNNATGIVCDQGMDLYCDEKDKTNTNLCIKGKCISKPFIDRPNYEKPYIPYTYKVSTSPTTSFSLDVPIYCRTVQDNKADSGVPATKENGRWKCEPGYFMDRGYTVGALKEASLISDSNASSLYLSDTDVIKTADYHYDDKDILKKAELKGAEALYKGYYVEFLERERTYLNKNRSYAKIKTNSGTIRDNSYLQLFDTLDCKLISYLKMSVEEGMNSPLDIYKGFIGLIDSLFKSSALGLIVLMMLLLFCFLLAGFILQAVLSYSISLTMIIILAYVSPVFFLFKLFNKTKGNYDTWYSLLKSYTFTPAVTFFSISLFMQIFDYTMFGTSDNYSILFDEQGNIKPDCYSQKLSDAPILCLFKKVISANSPEGMFGNFTNNIQNTFSGNISFKSFLGISMPMTQYDPALLLLLFAKLLQGTIILYINISILERLEKMIKSFFGIGGADATILGYSGNPTKLMGTVIGGAKKLLGSK